MLAASPRAIYLLRILVEQAQNRGQKEKNKADPETSSQSSLPTPPIAEVFWPEDLLPLAFPNCRILTFGYDSTVSNFFTGTANQNGISEHGNDLLKRLEAERRDENSIKRKIIFIVHSLGGLVLKEVSLSSSNFVVHD